MTGKSELIVALDVDSFREARRLVSELADTVNIFKVGSQLFTSCGPAVVRFIEAQGKQVFLDLKYHDIPNTVARAVHSAVEISVAVERTMEMSSSAHQGAYGHLLMLTVHTCGGFEMMRRAVAESTKSAEESGLTRPLVVGVTVLTSEEKQDNIRDLVLERAVLARKAGLDGVVASCLETGFLRQEFGKDWIIVTPGIRPSGAGQQDQKRVATPSAAVASGSSYLVVGRPVVQAENPAAAARAILAEMATPQPSTMEGPGDIV